MTKWTIEGAAKPDMRDIRAVQPRGSLPATGPGQALTPPATEPAPSPAPGATTPSNDEGDYLGYTAYADTLWARIQAALNRDAVPAGAPGQALSTTAQTPQPTARKPLGDDPLVVGIFGEWGAGKSKLLSLVQSRAEKAAKLRIQERHTNIEAGLTVPVFFQPWKYEHEPHLLIPLLLHILSALERVLKEGQTTTEGVAQKVEAGGDSTVGFLRDAFEKFKLLPPAAKAWLAGADLSGTTAMGLLAASLLASALPGAKKPSRRAAKDIHFADDGRTFYEIHTALKDITRPQKHGYTHPNTTVERDIALNFVIFIDDLDRCLPEKAVAVLELIKTIFNAESFAFVLALDEEVVERGIGHRYKDYTLVGKKPEMPITGFEYLEKIVHLPFRLPALTRAQAVAFMQRYEAELLAQRRLGAAAGPAGAPENAPKPPERTPWFTKRPVMGAARGGMALCRGGASEFREDESGGGGGAGAGARAQAKAASAGAGTKSIEHDSAAPAYELDLSALVIASFAAYVPRKLIRVVELFHQVLDVLVQRGTADKFEVGGDPATSIDPRIALAHMLLQLFQPDLHRTLRRTENGFDVLLGAFVAQSGVDPQDQRHLSDKQSDQDLLYWAVFYVGDEAPGNLRAATQRVPRLIPTDRYFADRVRLPIVERLLEHRAIARHVFDPLRLMAALQQSALGQALPLPTQNRWMSGLLAANAATLSERDHIDAPVQVLRAIDSPTSELAAAFKSELVAASPAPGQGTTPRNAAGDAPSAPAQPLAEWRTRVEVSDLDGLLLRLTAQDEPQQRGAPEAAGLQPGQVMSSQNAQQLAAFCQSRFLVSASADDKNANSRKALKTRLLRGLKHLAPHIAREDGAAFWDLVKDAESGGELGAPFTNTAQIAQRALWADVRSLLGQDPRFDPQRWYLPTERFAAPGAAAERHNDQQEPIEGFVRVNAGSFTMDGQGDTDNLKQTVTLNESFFIARYLTTVDQYACFMQDGGYSSPDFWDAQGLAWLSGEFDSKVTDQAFKAHLAKRSVSERNHPHDWAAQRSGGSRPVAMLNWFEARAYTRWLSARMASARLFESLPRRDEPNSTWRAQLPTEAQWERAARAENFEAADARRWPWGDEAKDAGLRANITDSQLGETSSVGLFGASPLGLSDLSGNTWEWQDNLFDKLGKTVQVRLPKDQELKSHTDWQQSDRPALRGGSWNFTSQDARCGCRLRNLPGVWHNLVGFRVVLSLA